MNNLALAETLTNAFITAHIMACDGLIKSDESMKTIMLELETAFKKLDQVELKVRHLFSPGIYMRELTVPAGTIAIGKIQKVPNASIISSGELLLLTEKRTATRIKAPYAFTTELGNKRAAYFIKDTVWTAIYHTNETDLDKLEAELIGSSFIQ